MGEESPVFCSGGRKSTPVLLASTLTPRGVAKGFDRAAYICKEDGCDTHVRKEIEKKLLKKLDCIHMSLSYLYRLGGRIFLNGLEDFPKQSRDIFSYS